MPNGRSVRRPWVLVAQAVKDNQEAIDQKDRDEPRPHLQREHVSSRKLRVTCRTPMPKEDPKEVRN